MNNWKIIEDDILESNAKWHEVKGIRDMYNKSLKQCGELYTKILNVVRTTVKEERNVLCSPSMIFDKDLIVGVLVTFPPELHLKNEYYYLGDNHVYHEKKEKSHICPSGEDA